MSALSGTGWVRPDNWRLLAGICGLQVFLIALPALWSPRLVWLLSAQLLVLAFALFSVQRTLLVLLLVNVVLPAKVLSLLILPGGFRLQEGLFIVALVFAAIDLIYRRQLRLRPGPADRLVLFFLAATALSVLTGFLRHNETTVILRDARFPLYYGVFFLVTHFVDEEAVLRRFLPALALAALAVAAEYILEFIGAIDLSIGSRFVRVARLQGVALPVVMLFLVNQFIHDPERYGRWVLLGAFLPLSLAFVLTVGRGMWVAFAAGLFVTAFLWHLNRPAARRRLWQAALLVAAMAGVIGATVFLFQRFTGAAVGAHALERSRAFVDFARDVHVLGRLSSYAVTLEDVARQPILGSGQGATLRFFNYDEESDRFELLESWTVDNLYLSLLWKMGLVGLAAFAWMALRLLRLAYRTFRSDQEPQIRAFAGGCVATFAAMGVLGLSDASMISGRFALVFGMLFGMAAVVAGARQETRE